MCWDFTIYLPVTETKDYCCSGVFSVLHPMFIWQNCHASILINFLSKQHFIHILCFKSQIRIWLLRPSITPVWQCNRSQEHKSGSNPAQYKKVGMSLFLLLSCVWEMSRTWMDPNGPEMVHCNLLTVSYCHHGRKWGEWLTLPHFQSANSQFWPTQIWPNKTCKWHKHNPV